MPFPMTHLYIAYNILSNTPQIKKPCDFMLGALAPDSVHFRDNYNSDMKKKSHLCVGDEKWGRVTNNQEWLTNVLAFLRQHEHMKIADFIYGYCSHIIADIQNNIKIWTPFLTENIKTLENGTGSLYYQESNGMDYTLYLSYLEQRQIWEMLEAASGYDIPDVVVCDEINKMKHHILHIQYSERKSADVSLNKYVTLSGMQEFISFEAEYIRRLLFKKV